MNDWKARKIGSGQPPDVEDGDLVRYCLEGEDFGRRDKAGNIAWDGADGVGAVKAYEVLARGSARTKAGVGDVNGTEKGSGARFNSEKPDLSLIPAGLLADYLRRQRQQPPRPAGVPVDWTTVLDLLHGFQMRTLDAADALFSALLAMDNDGQLWADCARVFSYGKAKYAAWNWARGQAWSIPLACAMRHIVFGELWYESIDPESGLPHRGHVACNIVMLLWFMGYYPEGDDRPLLP